MEIDYGDVKPLEAALRASLTSLQSLVPAYDWNLYIDPLAALDPLVLQVVMDANPSLLTLEPGAAALLTEAKAAPSDGFDAYHAGPNFIRNSDDTDQSDDLFAILPQDLIEEQSFRITLSVPGDSIPIT